MSNPMKEANALLDELREDNRRKPVTINGVTYESMKEMLFNFKISEGRLRNRLSRGWTVEEAVGIKKRKPSNRKNTPVEIAGKHFDSVSDAARYYGLTKQTLSNRLNRGWTPEEAVEIVPRKNEAPPRYTIDGKGYRNLKELAEDHGITLTRLNHFLYVKRLPLDKALKRAKTYINNCVPVEIDGVKYDSAAQAAKKLGWGYSKAYRRAKQGPYKKKRAIEIDGIKFESISAAARYFGVAKSTMCQWVNDGIAIEEKVNG